MLYINFVGILFFCQYDNNIAPAAHKTVLDTDTIEQELYIMAIYLLKNNNNKIKKLNYKTGNLIEIVFIYCSLIY